MRSALASLACVPLFATPVLAQGLQYTWPGAPAATTASPAGDVDADGVQDFLFGDVRPGDVDADFVRVRSGATGAVVWAVSGAHPRDDFGATVTGIGDVDGDGHADVAAAAWTSFPSGPGYVRVHSGATSAVLWRSDAPAADVQWGRSLARVRDLDQDGVDELVLGAPGVAAHVLVLSGATGNVLHTLTGAGPQAFDFGVAVASAGDTDLDGFDDLVVGDPEGLAGFGAVTIFSGASGAQLRRITGAVLGGGFGSDVASLGDVDGDGLPDLVVAAPYELITPNFNSGRARLFSGASGAPLLTLQDGPNLMRFAEGVDRGPDLDHDGRADVLLGAGVYRIGCCTQTTAEARIYSSATGALLQSAPASHPDLARVPDANGDGLDDFLIPALTIGTQGASALAVSNAPIPSIVTLASCVAKTTSQGCTPNLRATGAPSLTGGDPLAFLATDVVPSSFGMCLWSTSSAQTPFAGGMLCVAQPFHRWPIVSTGTPQPSTLCTGSLSGTLVSRIAHAKLAATGVAPGQALFVQVWFRDPGFTPPNDVGLSSGLRVTLWP